MASKTVEGSFRDPSGFLFFEDKILYRQVNKKYQENYDMLMGSGLYAKLAEKGLLIPHEEADISLAKTDEAYRIIKPRMLDFISYPYEWSFSQLKDAALATLEIEKLAMEYGMSLKDSSGYNIQFSEGRPVLIDTLSFEKYEEGKPWVAYRQFCQHFYAPLTLMSYKDIRLAQLLKVYIDGIPLDLASSLLPGSTKFKFPVLGNIHLHAKTQKSYSDKPVDVKAYKMSRISFLAMIDSLTGAVRKLKWQPEGTEWGDYYNNTNYNDVSFEHKKTLLESFLTRTDTHSVWDIGANTGVFSRVAGDRGINTVSFDIDPVAVEKNYLQVKKTGEKNILPLLLDLTNPSPAIGWNNEERMSFSQRKLPDTVFALALIHHIAISNNVPLDKIAAFFSNICTNLIIEFVPKSDSQVKKLLATREDIFDQYDQAGFEKAFSIYFDIAACEKISQSDRTLYLLKKK